MLTVEEALEAIVSRVEPLGTERVEILSALGRVLAEPIVSRRETPPWPNSSMHGSAVRPADTGRGVALTVVGRVEAGSVPAHRVGAGEAIRIFTCSPCPRGGGALRPPG